MIHIREIDHVVLRVTNLDAMLQFYCGVLGCNVEKRQETLGLIQLRAGRSLIDLVPVDDCSRRAALIRFLDGQTGGAATLEDYQMLYLLRTN